MRWLVKAAFNRLPWAVKYELFYQAGRALGVHAYQVNGSAGPIFGHLYDQSIIKSYLRDGKWSDDISAMISDVFKNSPGGTFYDIGANVGTVVIRVAANHAVRCIGFEPEPRNFALLSANVHAQATSNIELMRVAVAAEKGQMRFEKSDYNSGDHRLSADGGIMVDVIALDDLPMPDGPFAVKIDTQGAEPLIVQGGERTLSRADLIIAEFEPWAIRRMGLDPAPIIEFAQKYFARGYVLHHGHKMLDLMPIAEVVVRLQDIAARGGKFDKADLILVR